MEDPDKYAPGWALLFVVVATVVILGAVGFIGYQLGVASQLS